MSNTSSHASWACLCTININLATWRGVLIHILYRRTPPRSLIILRRLPTRTHTHTWKQSLRRGLRLHTCVRWSPRGCARLPRCMLPKKMRYINIRMLFFRNEGSNYYHTTTHVYALWRGDLINTPARMCMLCEKERKKTCAYIYICFLRKKKKRGHPLNVLAKRKRSL